MLRLLRADLERDQGLAPNSRWAVRVRGRHLGAINADSIATWAIAGDDRRRRAYSMEIITDDRDFAGMAEGHV
jgi:hypothetical protein